MHSLTQFLVRRTDCLIIAVTGLSLFLAQSSSFGQSVFTTDFEAPDYTTGTLVSDPDWSFDSVDLDVQVTAADYFSGLQSLSLTGAAPFDFSRDPLLALPSVIWLDLQLKPIFAEVADLPLSFSADRTAVTGFVKLNTEGEVYAVDGDGQGSGQWLATGSYATLSGDQSQDWLRLTYRLDYNTKTWDLFIGGQMIAADLGFLNTAATSFDQFTLRGDEAQASGFDSFDVRQDNPFYTDADNDAIDDAYEIAHGLNTSLNDRDQDLDFDTLSNLAEYLANSSATNADTDGDGVDDGSELANGADPTVADAYSLSSLPFSEDFETAPLGDFSSSAWSISGSAPQVQDSEAASGTQALSLSSDTILSNAIDGSDESVVWIDVYIRPQLLATAPSVDAAQGYYFNQDGQALALDGLGDGSGLWQLLDVATAGDWRRVTTKLDYASQTYDLYIDGGRVATGLGFAKVKPFLSELELSGAALTYADTLSASASEPAALDNDRDGWDNATETSATTNPEVFDTDADGLADSLEGLWGYDPLVTETGFAQLTETAASSGIYQWSSSFSIAEGYSDGVVNAQQDWIAAGDALIASEQLDLTDSTTAAASFERVAGIGETRRLWISFRAKLVPGALPEIASLNEPAVAIWGFNSSNSLKIWNQLDQDWQLIATEADATQWNDYALYFDYVEQEWLLSINGVLVADGLPFVDEDLVVFSRFKALQAQYTKTREVGEGPYTASFDDLVFSTAEPAWLDYDGDGLLNSLETQLGSDLLNSDSDADGMDDLWEYQNGLNLLVDDASGDLDGDGLENGDEYEYGLNPQGNDVEGAFGFVRRDIWTGIGGDLVTDLTEIERFPTNPNQRLWLNSLNLPSSARPGNNYGQRIFGYIVAPETADYTFWIAGADSCEFWLSIDSSSFNRERICYLDGRVSHQEWDRLLSQKSLSVTLQAGQAYYFEILHKDAQKAGRVAVAWQYGSQARKVIFGEYLGTSITEPGDQDQDGLPDDWEIANGLDPLKGFGRDGYAGDLDTDGLMNYQERQAGTDPTLMDTDGDGYNDLFEIRELESDPLSPDEMQWSSVTALSGPEFSVVSGEWDLQDSIQASGSGGGMISAQITLPDDGIYQLEGVLTRIDDSPVSATKPVEFLWYVDGEYYGKSSITQDSSAATFDLFKRLGHLKAGNHTLSLRWLNVHRDAEINIDSVVLSKPLAETPEALAAWTEAEVAKFAYSTSIPQVSQVSPVCIEGRADVLSALQILPSAQPIRTGVGHWYADVPLAVDEATTVSVSLQNGGRIESHSIEWAATNVFDQDAIVIRAGDSLKLDGNPSSSTGGSFNVTLNGLNIGVGLNDYVVHLFDTAGEYTVTVDYTALDGTVSSDTMTISVVDIPVVAEPAVVWAGRSRAWEWPQLPSNVFVEAVGMELELLSQSQSTTNFTLGRDDALEELSITARLSENGPILTTVPVRAFRLQASVEGYLTGSSVSADTYLVNNQICTYDLPDSVEIKINVFRAGVVLDDGERTRYVDSAGLDDIGRYDFSILHPKSVGGASCHRIEVYEGALKLGTH